MARIPVPGDTVMLEYGLRRPYAPDDLLMGMPYYIDRMEPSMILLHTRDCLGCDGHCYGNIYSFGLRVHLKDFPPDKTYPINWFVPLF